MSKLILGTNKGMPFEEVEPWARSAVNTGNSVLMILMGENKTTEQKLNDIGVETIVTKSSLGDWSANNERFFFQYEVLKNRKEKYSIMTDARDVIFQKDPMPFLIDKIENKNYDLVCAGEGLLYIDEPWGNGNLKQSYPDLYERYKNKPIMNVGVIGGITEKLAELSLQIYNMTKTSKTNYHSDQSSFNVICYDEEKYGFKVYTSNSDEGFAAHCGTVVKGVKMGAFNLRDENQYKLLNLPAIIEDGIVKTGKKEPYLIVHQWDRVPKEIFVNTKF